MKLSKIVLIVMIIASISVVYFRFLSRQNEDTKNIEYLTALYAERMRSVIAEAADVTEVIDALLVANKGFVEEDELTTLMSLAYNEENHIAIAYMPDGIITKVYPLKGNEASIGYNVFEDETAKHDALTAVETRRTAYSGPYLLMIGTPGLVARNPVYYMQNGQEVFWGFVAAIIRPTGELFKKAGLVALEDLNYEYTVQSNYNGNQVNLHATKDFSNEKARIYHDFQIGQGNWQISIYQNDNKKKMLHELIFMSFTMIIFTLLIYFALRQSEQKQRIAHTQSLTDALTNLYNRRALQKYEERRGKEKLDDSYTIFYIDLNKFKPVNDKHGHETGDQVLALFAERLLSQFRKDTFISRVGGDEFVIIFPSVQDSLQCQHVQERIIRLSEDPFFINTHKIYISCSIGYASYPEDGKDFGEVLASADKKMYKYKVDNRSKKEQ